jgi:hypothetical protein
MMGWAPLAPGMSSIASSCRAPLPIISNSSRSMRAIAIRCYHKSPSHPVMRPCEGSNLIQRMRFDDLGLYCRRFTDIRGKHTIE